MRSARCSITDWNSTWLSSNAKRDVHRDAHAAARAAAAADGGGDAAADDDAPPLGVASYAIKEQHSPRCKIWCEAFLKGGRQPPGGPDCVRDPRGHRPKLQDCHPTYGLGWGRPGTDACVTIIRDPWQRAVSAWF